MGRRAKIPAITALCITESSMEPLSSTAITTRHWLYFLVRLLKYTCSTISFFFSGLKCARFLRIVFFTSRFLAECTGLALFLSRLPRSERRISRRSFSSISSATFFTIRRAASSTSPFIRCFS